MRGGGNVFTPMARNTASQADPLSRTTANAARPGGVDRAKIVFSEYAPLNSVTSHCLMPNHAPSHYSLLALRQ